MLAVLFGYDPSPWNVTPTDLPLSWDFPKPEQYAGHLPWQTLPMVTLDPCCSPEVELLGRNHELRSRRTSCKAKAQTPLIGTVLQDMEWGFLQWPNSSTQFDPPITLMAGVLPSLSSHSAFISALWFPSEPKVFLLSI